MNLIQSDMQDIHKGKDLNITIAIVILTIFAKIIIETFYYNLGKEQIINEISVHPNITRITKY